MPVRFESDAEHPGQFWTVDPQGRVTLKFLNSSVCPGCPMASAHKPETVEGEVEGITEFYCSGRVANIESRHPKALKCEETVEPLRDPKSIKKVYDTIFGSRNSI